MKKILLVSGCSFTDDKFVSGLHPEMDCSWPKWPEILAKKLDMECINLGQNGAGNEYIYFSLLDEILKFKDKSQIGLVMPAWTQCQRQDYELSYSRKPVWVRKRFYDNGNIFGWLRKSLRYFVSLQLMCERYNIPLKQFQMLALFDHWINGLGKTDEEKYRHRNNPNFSKRYTYPGLNPKEDRIRCQRFMLDYEPYINVKDFIGWPVAKQIGGFHIEEETLWENSSDLIISRYDMHPNEKGQQKIAEFLYDRLG